MLPLPVGACPPWSSPLTSLLVGPVHGQRHPEGFNRLSLKGLWRGVCGGLSLDSLGHGSLTRVCAYVGRQMSMCQTRIRRTVSEPRGCRGPCWPPAPPVPGHASGCSALGWLGGHDLGGHGVCAQ